MGVHLVSSGCNLHLIKQDTKSLLTTASHSQSCNTGQAEVGTVFLNLQSVKYSVHSSECLYRETGFQRFHSNRVDYKEVQKRICAFGGTHTLLPFRKDPMVGWVENPNGHLLTHSHLHGSARHQQLAVLGVCSPAQGAAPVLQRSVLQRSVL